MKVALLAGGWGTRLSEETVIRPKPLVEIGGRPIMWHIMKTYAHYGLRDFVIIGGYKVQMIREYFMRYQMDHTDFTIDLKTGRVEWLSRVEEDWRVTVVDTGVNTMTGGRLKRVRHLLSDGTFCLTYGDGVSNVDIGRLLETHRELGRWCTLTAVTQPGRYGSRCFRKTFRLSSAYSARGLARMLRWPRARDPHSIRPWNQPTRRPLINAVTRRSRSSPS